MGNDLDMWEIAKIFRKWLRYMINGLRNGIIFWEMAYIFEKRIKCVGNLLVRQMEIPVSPMTVAVHRRSLRLPYSLRAKGVWSGQIPFLSGS